MDAEPMYGYITFRSGSAIARLALAFLLLLAGCAIAPSLALSGMDVLSIANTDRTLAGNAANAFADEDCPVFELVDGESRCLSLAEREALLTAQKRYCYRSLGGITCYTVRDPYHDGAQHIE